MMSILFEIKNGIGIITLNRPEKFNAFNREMALSLQEKLNECSTNREVRAVLLTGNGKAFCAGQDLQELTGDDPIAFDKILKEHYNPIVTQIRNLAKPVIAAVNGVAAGAGANIALACDVVVASESASFIQAFSKIGLIPDSGGTFFLPRLIGFQRASAIMMLGDKISAAEALQIGMLYKVFPADSFLTESLAIAATMASMPTRSFELTKKALNASMHNSFAQQLELEDQLQLEAANTKDYAEGVEAFLQKRTPVYSGE
jgi:2-(1,2-epoxy-1,2-dihydrophenyl)acetyl-CoA isomerase